MTVQIASATHHPPGRVSRYLAAAGLAILVATVVAVVVSAPGRSDRHSSAATVTHAAARGLPPYWFVRSGDTFTEIAAKTGLTVAQLESFNPQVDPSALLPGQRLNLWLHPPKPHHKPPGPTFWTVRQGESFGSIAAKTGINIIALERLNPQLKPATLQPGNRVRLRQ